jgi:hypothetical protein
MSILTSAIRFFIMTNNIGRVKELLQEALQLHSVVNHEITLNLCMIILTNCISFFRQKGLSSESEFCEKELKKMSGNS